MVMAMVMISIMICAANIIEIHRSITGHAVPVAPSPASCLPCHARTMRPRACRRPHSFGETYAKSGCTGFFLGGSGVGYQPKIACLLILNTLKHLIVTVAWGRFNITIPVITKNPPAMPHPCTFPKEPPVHRQI